MVNFHDKNRFILSVTDKFDSNYNNNDRINLIVDWPSIICYEFN